MQCWEEGPAAAWMQRELQYRCSSGSGRAMGSNTGGSSAVDVGQQAQHQYRYQCDVQWWSITRAHSSLRGSVDLG